MKPGEIAKRFETHLLTFLVLSVIMILSFGCAKMNRYDPYPSSENAPEPDYEGRQEDRYYSEKTYTKPPVVEMKENRMEKKVLPPEAELEPPRPMMSFSETPDYQLGPGDVVEVIYQLTSEKREEEYKINIQDELEVTFFYTPKYDRKVMVRVDGKVTLPLIGDVEVYDLTTKEVKNELLKRYQKLLKDPEIHVAVTKSNRAIEELKRAITTAPRGQSRLEPIRPDGFISLPLVGEVLVGGLTVPEASQAISQQYLKVGVTNIDVTLALAELRSPQVFVLGEVVSPGPIIIQDHSDAWRSIGMAGGFSEEADKRHVIVSKNNKSGEERFVLDFDLWRTDLDSMENIMIRRGDIIYVPKKEDRYVYILGAVEKPGRVRLDPETAMTVSQAVSMAGRIDAGANDRQVLVLRRSPEKDPIIIAADLKDLFKPKHYDKTDDYPPRDPYLQAGDVVYIPNAFIGDLDRFAEAYFKKGIWTIIPFNLNATYNLN